MPGDNVTLTPVTKDDLELLLAWRRLLPENATRSSVPSWEQHLAWFEEKSHDGFLICYEGRRVGFVGLRYDDQVDQYWISIHIAEPDIRASGIGSNAVRQAMAVLTERGHIDCYAEIHVSNGISQRFFSDLGFAVISHEGPFTVWRKDLDGD